MRDAVQGAPPATDTARVTLVAAVPEKAPTEHSRDSVDLGGSDALRFARVLAENMGRKLRFTKDTDTGRISVEVVDTESGEVVRSIPPEELARLSARLAEAVDLLFGRRGDPARPEAPGLL